MPAGNGWVSAVAATAGAVSLGALWYLRRNVTRRKEEPLSDRPADSQPKKEPQAEKTSWLGIVRKSDEADAELEQESKALVAVEEELVSAEARVAAAETHYNLARRQVDRELAKPLVEEKTEQRNVQPTSSIDTDAAEAALKDGHSQRVPKGSKNTSAMTDKEVSRDRWTAKRAAEGRVRNATKRARERLRRSQRDERFDWLIADADGGDVDPSPKVEATKAADLQPTAQTRYLSLTETDVIKEGAKGIADRLKNNPDAAGKRTSLVKVLVGGRENVYTFELSDVVVNLRERGLVDSTVSRAVLALLEETALAEKSGTVPPEDWLAHAQKISKTEPLDKPLKEAEKAYLEWLDRKRLTTAETELEKAEAKLMAALSRVETRYPKVCSEDAPSSPERRAGTEPDVDLDEASRLEDMHSSSKEQTAGGSKNTSALSEKAVSRQRWEAARGQESRTREKEVKAREARRTEARDRKMGAAEP